MRYLLIVLSMLLVPLTPARAEVSVGVGIHVPGVSIGINMPTYPRLVRVPGYPVYYDPRVNFNFFFYDGLYWVFHDDNWYASSWYNGPWDRVDRYDVPLYVLRVPVRYYRHPPPYFHGWRADAPPRWGEHWGRDWDQRHSGWDKWNRRSAPRPAPLPTYQRNYSGDRYPHEPERQQTIRTERYRYQPREPVTQQYYQQRVQQRQQDQQRQQEQQRQQQQKRQQEQQRQQQLKQQDLERRRTQPEAQGQDQKRKATQQELDRRKKATQEELDRKKKEEDTRDRYRQ